VGGRPDEAAQGFTQGRSGSQRVTDGPG